MGDSEDITNAFDFSQNTELRCLSISVNLRRFHLNHPTHAPFALLAIVKSQVTKLTLLVGVRVHEHLAASPWADFAVG